MILQNKIMKRIIKEIIGFPIGIMMVLLLPLILKGIGRGILASNCVNDQLSQELDLLAQKTARTLKQKKCNFEIGYNDPIEPYIDELDIYNNLKPKEVELLKAHIANYYYNLKK